MTVALPIVVGVLWYGRGFLIPLAITGLIFILASALVDRIGDIRLLGWSPPVWLAHLISAVMIISGILFFGIVVSDSAANVQEALPRYQERLSLLAGQLETILGPSIVDAVERGISRIDLTPWLAGAASQLGGALSLVALISLYLVFLISERTKWVAKIPRMAATKQGAETATKILHRIADGVKQYMWVNAVTSAMSGTVAFLIFSAIGLDFAPLLAFTVFVVGFIPNIGAFIGVALPCLVALVQFDSFTPFLIVLFGYGVADQIIGNIIQPSMQGRSLNLSTFMVMVSLTFFATLWGGIGAFLAVPMMVVVMVVCAEIPATRWIAVLFSSDGKLDDEDSSNTFP
ncbi:AI-2E family transporter [Marinobacter sp. F4206]|uniref:AI-2E family transporter n=1 Tax=Marinobacter sp. F4206 TaxID=2861777 RepID=UPI001C5CE0D7|nr:AI-2E family transporter [Marinobacter sp. F4206]MBW4936025.1 AI-2E family transporter [Marinobacter sp. F4206]